MDSMRRKTAPPTECTQSQPAVKVGNILGERGANTEAGEDHDTSTAGVQYHGPDQIAREFTIEPTDVWQGEANKNFHG